jgi:hypothetical protein
MNLDELAARLAKDLDWFSFYARYCAGKNIGKSFCRDFQWWMLGTAALVVALMAWILLGWLGRHYRNWRHRRSLAKVADAETMKQHVWSGYDSPDAVPGSEQRAGKRRGSTP